MAKEQTEGSLLQERQEKLKNIDWKEVRRSVEDLEHFSQRGWAIVAVAKIVEQLTALLRAFFVDEPRTVDQLLEDPGILSTFGAQIKLAFFLGLISVRERRMLDLIRKIRNDFAHNSEIASFSQSPIKERCLELDATKFPGHEDLCDPSNPREKFIAAFGFLLIAITLRGEQLEHREEAESITEDYLDSKIKEDLNKSEKQDE